MKKIFISILLLSSFFISFAQTEEQKVSSFKFNIGPVVGFPIGNNVVEYSFILGLTAQAEISVTNSLAVTATAGYVNYSYKTVAGSGNQGFIPLMAGLKYYISPRAFVHLQAGAAFCTKSITDASNSVQLNSGTFFEYAPGIGHKFGRKLEGEFMFNGVSNSLHQHLNAFSLRLGYNL